MNSKKTDQPSGITHPPQQISIFEQIEKVKIKFDEILNRIGTEIFFPLRILQLCKSLQAACSLNEDAAISTLFFKTPGRYSVIHPLQSALVCEILSKSLGFDPKKRLSLLAAAFTMNIAIIQLQDILYSQKEPLSKDQTEKILNHPIRGIKILQKFGIQDTIWLDAVLYHHRYLNGTGYPKSLQNYPLSETTRILTLADIFCAKISNRSYRKGLLPKIGLRELFLNESKHLVDLKMVSQLIKVLGIYPPGTFVQLSTGERGMVTHRGVKAHQPIVVSLIQNNGLPLEQPVHHDTSGEVFVVEEAFAPGLDLQFIQRNDLWIDLRK